MKPQLSIIIPVAGEYPQCLFTIQSIAQTLLGKIQFEIIAVDNYCQELEDQWMQAREKAVSALVTRINSKEQKMINGDDIKEIIPFIRPQVWPTQTSDALEASAGGNPWLKYMKFDKRLSHWECKRLACKEAKADTFLFIDGHCVASDGIADMYSEYVGGYDQIGTMHMPLTYKILEWRRLIYKMKIENSFYSYSFTGMKENEASPFEVSCMSTCGMMISKVIYERVGGWPCDFAAYGGGENFMNYALAVTGHQKFIYPMITLHHHGEKRDYHSTYDGTIWNRLAAHYLFGGKDALINLRSKSKGRPEVLDLMVTNILAHPEYQAQRELIRDNQVISSINDWAAKWKEG